MTVRVWDLNFFSKVDPLKMRYNITCILLLIIERLFVGERLDKLKFHPRCGSEAEVINGQSTAVRPK